MMDLFKRQLAPISADAWKEVSERAKQVLKSYLTARKVVNVVGPKGWDYAFHPVGRLERVKTDGEVGAGLRKAIPLLELRVPFKLDRWELDDIDRGVEDPDLEPLEAAAKEIALFEDNAIYNGFEQGVIQGLVKEATCEPIALGKEPEAVMRSLSRGVQILKDNFEEGPYTLVVNPDTMETLNSHIGGYPLVKRLETLLGGEILVSRVLEGALLLPKDHEDLEMIIGGDFEIGYQGHDEEQVELYLSESFTFRVLNPDIIVNLTLE